ncbi:uncharacterized protein LOC110442099 [Mizuhopecten yessoensis]|uniref:uncharacterized protein LOC110442099 n=1 Tax=Mizuhopecten yessoensis TaxID=6573 RepID=UPI000B45A1AA|nr:uncharacterized protein LOC110442099 [Mizuhopecten yessoensis]
MKLPFISDVSFATVMFVVVVYLCEAQSHHLQSASSSRLSPSSRFSRTFNDRRQSVRSIPVRSRSRSRSSPTRQISGQSSSRQSNMPQNNQGSSSGQGQQISSINNLSNAILLSALLGMDMPREQRMSNQRLIMSHLLGINAPQSQNQSPFSGVRSSSSSVMAPSSSNERGSFSPAFGNPSSSNFANSLPGHNLILQTPGQQHGQPLVIEAGGQIQVQEIKKPGGQTQVVINTSQNSSPSLRATTSKASTVPSLPTVNPYLLSGEDPPEKEKSPLHDIQELTKLLKDLGINLPKTGTVGR